MPFTLCHPAIVLPLHRYARGFTSLPALVIGSMAPDFVYFFSFGVSGPFSHSFPGIFLYCVPAGAALYALYCALIRAPLRAWLPGAVRARMGPQSGWPVRGARAAAVVLASLAAGAASHIVWDGFTHPNTAIVNYWDVLRVPVRLGAVEVPLFKVLQHMSSLVGFVVIATFSRRWYARTPPLAPVSEAMSVRQRWLAFGVVAGAAVLGGVGGLLFRTAWSAERMLFNFVVTGMAAGALALVLLCLVWTLSVNGRARTH